MQTLPVSGVLLRDEDRMDDELFTHAVEKLRAMRLNPVAPCKICGGDALPYDIVDFHKSCNQTLSPLPLSGIPVLYRACTHCGFIFTAFGDDFTGEQWARYVYNEDYAAIDPEYLDVRPRRNAQEIAALLYGREKSALGLDYGGGNGATTMFLRESGLNFDACDPFGYNDMALQSKGRYNICSAFEVFEHSPDPVLTLQTMVELCSPGELLIYLSTSLFDDVSSPENRLSWWYAAPRNGHISLFTRRSLQILGAKFGLTHATLSGKKGFHLLSRGMSEQAAHRLLAKARLIKAARSRWRRWTSQQVSGG